MEDVQMNADAPSGNGSKPGSSASTRNTQLWMDCDAGIDDAQGLLLALAAENVQIKGISCVFGNVDIQKVAINVARVLTLANRMDVPFYVGAGEPLLGQAQDATFFHGSDGLGDVPLTHPAVHSILAKPSPELAVLKLVEAARQSQGDLVVVATGPLTNLALACKLEPDLPLLIKEVYVMGGAEARGNVTPSAEFNFHCDPEAAHLVLRKFSSVVRRLEMGTAFKSKGIVFKKRKVLISWECTITHGLEWEWVDQWLGSHDTPAAHFMAAAMASAMKHQKATSRDATWVACDPIAVAAACNGRELVTRDVRVFCDVELHGQLTRGACVFDWEASLKRPCNVRLVTGIDKAVFKRMLDASLS